MSLRFIAGFDHYVTADIAEKWSSVVATPIISAGNGRRSSASLRCPNASGSAANVIKTLDAQATWIVGAALKVIGLPSVDNAIIELLDAGTVHVDLRLRSDGTLRATRAGTTLGTSVFALSTGTFRYIELKALISDTVGTIDVVVDGANVLSLTGQDTRNAGNATANQISIGGAGSGSTSDTYDWDDLYICDGAGSTNNNFLGDVRVDYYAPTGAGNSAQLARGGSDSGANWSQVDDAAPNDDTDYCDTSTVGQKDTHSFANMSHTPSSIFGVQVMASAKKDDAGARSLATVARSSTTESDGATSALSTSYLYYMDIKEQDPNTSAAWTKAGFDAAEFGAKCAA